MIVDNRAMHPLNRSAFSACLACLALSFACASVAAETDALRERFAASSIDSNEKADAVLAASSGARLRAEKQYKAAAQECLKKFMVNDCIEAARKLRHDRLSGIEAVQIEANRFKRRDKADRIEADRARHEAERAANAGADTELRANNRKNFEDRNGHAKREAAERARSDAARAGHPATAHSPLIKTPKPGSPEANAAQRAKNAAEQAAKIKDAAVHREELARRHAEKEADRARRAQQQAKKEAERQAAQRTAASGSAPKP